MILLESMIKVAQVLETRVLSNLFHTLPLNQEPNSFPKP